MAEARLAINPRLVLAQRNALVALTRMLIQEQSGGMLFSALEILDRALPSVVGALAYRSQQRELLLVSDLGLPRKAKPWLSHLPLDGEPWFVAQVAAHKRRCSVDANVADTRHGHSIRPALQRAGWGAVVAAPMTVGRELFGVLVLAAPTADALDRETQTLLETTCGILALALVRQRELERQREERVQDTRATELAAVGLLASSITQQLAAPLGSMVHQLEEQEALVRALRERLSDCPGEVNELGELTYDLLSQVRRARDVTDQLRAVSRESAPTTLDLARVVASSVALMQPAIEARGIRLTLHGDDLRLPVCGRAESLRMLTLQLLLYGAELLANSEGGGAAPRMAVALAEDERRQILTVEIVPCSEDTRTRVYDAFGGRGDNAPSIGIALAKQAVRTHAGHIEVGRTSPAPGHRGDTPHPGLRGDTPHPGLRGDTPHPGEPEGTYIRVVLPAAHAELLSRESTSRPPPTLRAPDTGPLPKLVWVDDDDTYVRTMKRSIKTHETVSAGSIADAKLLLYSLDVLPTVVFCDLHLPDGMGIELHAAMEPELADRFIFVTGGVVSPDVARYVMQSGCPTLIKPLSLDEIGHILSEDHDASHSSATVSTLAPPPDDDEPLTSPGRLAPGYDELDADHDPALAALGVKVAGASLKPPPLPRGAIEEVFGDDPLPDASLGVDPFDDPYGKT